MAEPTGETPGTAPASVARHGTIAMGVAIASLIAFFIVAIGAFWAINGDALNATVSRPAIAVEAETATVRPTSPGPGQIGNITEGVARKPN